MSKICQCVQWKARSCFLEGSDSFTKCPWCGSNLVEEEESKVDDSETKESALDELSDLVASYLHYDRREDEELTFQMMTELLKSGRLKQEEIVERFALELKKAIEKNFLINKKENDDELSEM